MLTPVQFDAWCSRLGFSEETKQLIREIREGPPTRRVRSNTMSVPGQYPSRKMGFTVQFESHTVEFPLVYKLEWDHNVLEYYCQPKPLLLTYKTGNGRQISVNHTPDYFALRTHSAGWIEAKDRNALPDLADRMPNRYQLVDSEWKCPPGIAAAGPLGLTYEVHSSGDVSDTLVRNFQFLDDFLRKKSPVHSANKALVFDRLQRHPSTTLSDLLADLNGHVCDDDIYHLIATSEIYVDLSAALLIAPENVRVFADSIVGMQFHAASHAERPNSAIVDIGPNSKLLWDQKVWTVLNCGENTLAMLGEDSSLIELPRLQLEKLLQEGRISCPKLAEGEAEHPEVEKRMKAASKRDLKIASQRLALIEPYLPISRDSSLKKPSRTTRRFIRTYREAQETYGNGYIGLLPLIALRGNRDAKMQQEVISLMRDFISRDHEVLDQPTKWATYTLFKTNCESKGFDSPSFVTFCDAIKMRPQATHILKRKGRRAAYNSTEFCWVLDRHTPPHGDRPFEIAHIDHTEIDLELLFPESGKGLGRVWATFLVDANTRRVLAYDQSFEEPSYRSCMMVMRECVRRWGRLPQIIVVDGGPEFRSTYFDTLAGRFEITLKRRPKAKARFGSVGERLFGTTNTEFIHNLRGNTQITRNVRQVTVSNDPKRRAVWDFPSYDQRMEDYLYERYDTIPHPALLGQSPREAFQTGIVKAGARKHRYYVYNSEFLMATAPSTRSGKARVEPGRGVTINYFKYWSDAFRDPLVENKKVDVRYDPFDLGVAWGYVRGRWVECYSHYTAQLRGVMEKMLRLTTKRIRHEMTNGYKRKTALTARIISEFLSTLKNDEEIMLQRLRDRELQQGREQRLLRAKGIPRNSERSASTPEYGGSAAYQFATSGEAPTSHDAQMGNLYERIETYEALGVE